MSESSDDIRKQLYEAAVGYMVSDRSETNAWEQVVAFAVKFLDGRGIAVDPIRYREEGPKALKAEFQAVEAQVKKDYSVSKLPGKWRSAKATVLAAVGAGEPIMRDAVPIPKTALAKATKAATSASVPKNPLAEFQRLIDGASAVFATLGPGDQMMAVAMANGAAWMPMAAMFRSASASAVPATSP